MTRWVEKTETLQEFDELYEALMCCFEEISSNESNEWDTKSISDAYGLLKRITDSTFIIAFQTVHYFFGFTKGLSEKLQGSSLDIAEGYNMIVHKRLLLSSLRKNVDKEFEIVFNRAEEMAKKA